MSKMGTQTDLGKLHGLSSIATGKILLSAGLKDPETKGATAKALEEGYATSFEIKLKKGDSEKVVVNYSWNLEKCGMVIAEYLAVAH